MATAAFLQILQSLVVIAVTPLHSEMLAGGAAIVAAKWVPSVVRPFRNLAKRQHKSSATSDQASRVFRDGPFLACCLAVLGVHPVIANEPLPLAFPAEMHWRAHRSVVCDLATQFGAARPLGGLSASGLIAVPITGEKCCMSSRRTSPPTCSSRC